MLPKNETLDHFLPDPPSPLKRNLPNIQTLEPHKVVTSHHIQVSRSIGKQLYIRGPFKVKQNLSLFFYSKNIVLIDKSMLSGGDEKYDIGSDPLPPFEMNFVLRATLNFMNGPLGTNHYLQPRDKGFLIACMVCSPFHPIILLLFGFAYYKIY